MFSKRFSRDIQAAGMAVALALLAIAAHGEVIRLKPAASVDSHQDVRLGDIAVVTGPDARQAEELAGTIILSGVERPQKIKAESILMAVMAQRGAASLGSLQVSGAAECQISLASAEARTPVAAVSAAPITPAAPATGAATPAPAASSLHQAILASIIKESGVAESDLHILIETVNPAIERPVSGGQKWVCRPLTRTILGTVQLDAQLEEGSRVVQRLVVQTRVEQRQSVVILDGRLKRGEIVTSDKLRTEDAWLDRKVPTLFAAIPDAVGMEAQRDVDPGTRLDQRDFKAALMAHRNELITVYYLAGNLQVQLQGRAMDDAKMHDRVQIRNESTGEKYGATMIGRNLAVAGGVLTDEQERTLREAQ